MTPLISHSLQNLFLSNSPFFMSHNWISCRNAPLLTLLAQPGTILPESLGVADHSGKSWVGTGIFPNYLPAPEWHSSVDPVPHQAFPVFKSQPLSPAPLDWRPSHCTWGTRDGTAELSTVPIHFSTFPTVLLDFQFTSNSKHSYLGSSYLSWQYRQVICFKLHGFMQNPSLTHH